MNRRQWKLVACFTSDGENYKFSWLGEFLGGGGVTDERVDGGVHWFVASAGADVRGGVLALGLAPMAFGAEAQWSEGKE
jgi:hypothetical protein